MGCGLSSQPPQSRRHMGIIRVNILDNQFLCRQNDKIRQKMQRLSIRYETYISLERMVESMQCQYVNTIITIDELVGRLVQQLVRVNLFPNILVKSMNKHNNKKDNNLTSKQLFNITQFTSYNQLIQQLSNRTIITSLKQLPHHNNKPSSSNHSNNIVNLKILLNQHTIANQTNSSLQLQIIQQTLKAKHITYQIYNSFAQLQLSFYTTQSQFIVCQYQYHREVLSLISDPYSTKLICICQFTNKQSYHPNIYFLTHNWMEIVNQIQTQLKLSHLYSVKCTKIFLYLKSQNHQLAQYAQTISKLGFDIRIYCDLHKIMTQSKHYFALTILCSSQQLQEVQQFLHNNNYFFKTKLISISPKTTQNNIKSLRKTLLQLKRGYCARKQTTRSIDIIDKSFDNDKFLMIRQQFSKYNIICHIYKNIDQYIHIHSYISPFIIVSQEQSSLLMRYLKQIKQSSCKLILYCHKHSVMISSSSKQIKNQKSFCFISDHFGKIINFVKSRHAYNPFIPYNLTNYSNESSNNNQQIEKDDFDKIDPNQIQHVQTDLESYKMIKYATTYIKNVK